MHCRLETRDLVIARLKIRYSNLATKFNNNVEKLLIS